MLFLAAYLLLNIIIAQQTDRILTRKNLPDCWQVFTNFISRYWRIFFVTFLEMLLAWYDQPQHNVGHQARQAAWDKQNKEPQPEPERANSKEFRQTTANTGNPAVISRTTQRTSLIHDIYLLFPDTANYPGGKLVILLHRDIRETLWKVAGFAG